MRVNFLFPTLQNSSKSSYDFLDEGFSPYVLHQMTQNAPPVPSLLPRLGRLYWPPRSLPYP